MNIFKAARAVMAISILLTCEQATHAQVETRMPPRVNAPWEPSWSKWAQNPEFVTLVIRPSVAAQAETSFYARVGDQIGTNTGLNCYTLTNGTQLNVPVRLNYPIVLEIGGSNVGWIHFELDAPPCA